MKWLAIALLVCAAAPRAHADEMKADCEAFEITAKKGDKPSIDADLKHLEKKLQKQPFAWNQFKFLSRSDLALVKKKPEQLKLKIGSGAVTLVEVVEKSKVRITVTMSDEHGKGVVDNTTSLEAGDTLVFGHPLANGDGHLLALTCK